MRQGDIERMPVLVENGAPVPVKVTTVGDDWSLAYCHDGGLRVEPFGQPLPNIRAAAKLAARMNARAGV